MQQQQQQPEQQRSGDEGRALHGLLGWGWESVVDEWLREDVPSFDYGGYVVGDKEELAVLLGKGQGGVLAGCPFFDAVFRRVGCTVEWKATEGTSFTPIAQLAYVRGPARYILQGERVALNMIARASGIATLARSLATTAQQHGFKGTIAGTRKTTPGFRLVEKYAMLVGGVDTHRYDLSSMVMLKDNHIISAGSITAAVKKARSVCGFSLKIEVECQNTDEAEEAIQAGADVVMLDNFSPEQLKEGAKLLKSKHKHVLVEASGGITADTIHQFFCEDVDVISLGALSQGVPHVDYSLKIQRS
ncbi:Nicotinate-nucleotide pyrophosphorylase [carboxylating] [Balamuthia mandrillaris]